jgi:hypothetical protein
MTATPTRVKIIVHAASSIRYYSLLISFSGVVMKIALMIGSLAFAMFAAAAAQAQTPVMYFPLALINYPASYGLLYQGLLGRTFVERLPGHTPFAQQISAQLFNGSFDSQFLVPNLNLALNNPQFNWAQERSADVHNIACSLMGGRPSSQTPLFLLPATQGFVGTPPAWCR